MTTKTQRVIIHAVISLAIGIFFCGNANAIKIKVFSFPEQLSIADIVVVGEVSKTEGGLYVKVSRILKGPQNQAGFILDIASRREEDRTLSFNVPTLICVQKEMEGRCSLVGFGTQSIWPKISARWPFNKAYMSSLEEVSKMATQMLKLQNTDTSEELATLLKSMLSSAVPIEVMAALDYAEWRPTKIAREAFESQREALRKFPSKEVIKRAAEVSDNLREKSSHSNGKFNGI